VFLHDKEISTMNRAAFCLTTTLAALSPGVSAIPVVFDTDPFAGSTALTTPGRQVVGGESFITFNVGSDVFLFRQDVFGVDSSVTFVNDLASNLPSGGVNVIVLQNTDVPFAAGIAANLIAAEISSPGPGFFVYFNSGLDLPRLVYSTDLDDDTADLKVLARMTNFSGNPAVLPTFTAANFQIFAVPEPSSLLLLAIGAAMGSIGYALRRERKAFLPV
jgi:hypothetical protein